MFNMICQYLLKKFTKNYSIFVGHYVYYFSVLQLGVAITLLGYLPHCCHKHPVYVKTGIVCLCQTESYCTVEKEKLTNLLNQLLLIGPSQSYIQKWVFRYIIHIINVQTDSLVMASKMKQKGNFRCVTEEYFSERIHMASMKN